MIVFSVKYDIEILEIEMSLLVLSGVLSAKLPVRIRENSVDNFYSQFFPVLWLVPLSKKIR